MEYIADTFFKKEPEPPIHYMSLILPKDHNFGGYCDSPYGDNVSICNNYTPHVIIPDGWCGIQTIINYADREIKVYKGDKEILSLQPQELIELKVGP